MHSKWYLDSGMSLSGSDYDNTGKQNSRVEGCKLMPAGMSQNTTRYVREDSIMDNEDICSDRQEKLSVSVYQPTPMAPHEVLAGIAPLSVDFA